MVLSERSKQRVARRGQALTWSVALAALVATPLLACPPKAKSKGKADAAPRAQQPLRAPATAPHSGGGTTFDQFMESQQEGDASDLERRLHELERRIEELQRRLRGAAPGPSTGGAFAVTVPAPPKPPSVNIRVAPPAPGPAQTLRVPRAPRAPKAPNALRAPRAPQAPAAPRANVIIAPASPRAALRGTVVEDRCTPGRASVVAPAGQYQIAGLPQQVFYAATGQDGGLQVRTYALDRDKLEDLIALMARPDVPTMIRDAGEVIEVHATPHDQAIFEAFCLMIDTDEASEKAYVLSSGKLKALTELMSRSDVPVLIEPGDKAIVVHGSPLEQRIFDAFVRMIDPASSETDVHVRHEYADVAEEQAHAVHEDHVRELEHVQRQLQQELKQAMRHREQAMRDMERARGQQQREVEREHRQLERHQNQAHRHMEKLHGRLAEVLEHIDVSEAEAEELAAMVASLAERVEGMSAEERAEIERKMHEVGRAAQRAAGEVVRSLAEREEIAEAIHSAEVEMETIARALAELAESGELVGHEFEDAMEDMEVELEAMIEALEEELEAVMEAIEEAIEEAMDEVDDDHDHDHSHDDEHDHDHEHAHDHAHA